MRASFLRSHLRGLLAASLFLFASAAPAGAQNFLYAIDSGIQPQVMCSAHPSWCHAPIIHLINAATGHDLSTIALPASSAATSLRLSSDGTTLFATAGGTLFVVDALAADCRTSQRERLRGCGRRGAAGQLSRLRRRRHCRDGGRSFLADAAQ